MSLRVLPRTLAGALLLLAATVLLLQAPAQDAGAGNKAYLGLAGEMTPASANHVGVAVEALVPNGPAAKAGLRAGDVITKVDGQKIKGFETLAEAVENHKPGDKLKLTVARNDKERDIEVTLGTQPSGGRAGASPFPRGLGGGRGAMLGVQTQELTPELKQRLGVKSDKG